LLVDTNKLVFTYFGAVKIV